MIFKILIDECVSCRDVVREINEQNNYLCGYKNDYALKFQQETSHPLSKRLHWKIRMGFEAFS